VWEDNQAAITRENMELPRMTPGSNHIVVKYHWFRSKVVGKIEIQAIESNGLRSDTFVRLREMLAGW